MGKAQLKKEIQTLSREQLEHLVLEAYEARKEIKQYFDFFIDPDAARLAEKYKAAIDKELKRSKRGHSRARTSVIKRALKDFSSFQPGFEYELDLMFHTIAMAMIAEAQLNFTEAQCNAYGKLLLDMIALADRNLVADKILSRTTSMLDNPKAGSVYFRRFLKKLLDENL